MSNWWTSLLRYFLVFIFVFLSFSVHLNKQIQLLSKHLQVLSSQEVDRQFSRSAASSTSTPATGFSVDAERFNSQVYIRNEPANGSSTCYTSTSFVYEREPYTPQIIDVNYIDGSADAKWKRLDFSWTKELEVGFSFFFMKIWLLLTLWGFNK